MTTGQMPSDYDSYLPPFGRTLNNYGELASRNSLLEGLTKNANCSPGLCILDFHRSSVRSTAKHRRYYLTRSAEYEESRMD
jgi:hypothetical protein